HVRLPVFKEKVGSRYKGLAREFAPALRRTLARLDLADTLLLQAQRFAPVRCIQPFAITHPVNGHVQMIVLAAFVDHTFFLAFFLPLPFGRPPNLPHCRNCSFEYLLARVLPPIEPVLRKYSMTLSGM